VSCCACTTILLPSGNVREVLRLLDEEPVLDAELLKLGRWIADYYCAPLGEVLRAMTPLAGDVRHGKVYSLTTSGRDRSAPASSQFDGAGRSTGRDSADARNAHAYRCLPETEVSPIGRGAALARKARIRRRRGHRGRARSIACFRRAASRGVRSRNEEKLPKNERELLAYLELHPGAHNLADLEIQRVPRPATAARALARKSLVRLTLEPVAGSVAPLRPPHRLNPHQQAAYDRIDAALAAANFRRFSCRASRDRQNRNLPQGDRGRCCA
jgi:primosomal protein N' (replication factor Y)